MKIPLKALHAYAQGIESLAKKDAAGSLPHFQRAIAAFPGYYEAYDRIGAADLRLWRIPEAEQAFRKSIELSGGRFAHSLLALGAILDDQGKFTEAEEVIRKGLDLAPDSWAGSFYLGIALSGLNRLEEAEQNVREALRLKADFPEAQLLLADIHGREKDYRSVVSDLNEYLRIAPDSPGSAGARTLRESAQRLIVGSPSATAFAERQP